MPDATQEVLQQLRHLTERMVQKDDLSAGLRDLQFDNAVTKEVRREREHLVINSFAVLSSVLCASRT